MAEAKDSTQEPMTGEELAAIIEQLGLNKARFARLMCTTENNIFRYIAGTARIPKLFGNVARLFAARPTLLSTFIKISGRDIFLTNEKAARKGLPLAHRPRAPKRDKSVTN